jgi:hypothetical protein
MGAGLDMGTGAEVKKLYKAIRATRTISNGHLLHYSKILQ